MKLKQAAEKLRDYLVEHDFAGTDGDVPDEIWKPFCRAINGRVKTRSKFMVKCYQPTRRGKCRFEGCYHRTPHERTDHCQAYCKANACGTDCR